MRFHLKSVPAAPEKYILAVTKAQEKLRPHTSLLRVNRYRIQRQSRTMSALRRTRPSAIPRQADAMSYLVDVLSARFVPQVWRFTRKRLR